MISVEMTFTSYEGAKKVFFAKAKDITRAVNSGRFDIASKHLREFINLAVYGQSISPIVTTFITYDDVKEMDVDGFPRLAALKAHITEVLAVADAADRSYYKASPVGLPFESRIRAVQPLMLDFMRTATKVSRKNAQRALKRRMRRPKRIRRF